MPVTSWTDVRLQKLFERYRKLYWPRSRRLLRYEVRFEELAEAIGLCSFTDRLISIDLRRNRSDRELRATVLHEMCHAVAGPGTSHDTPFFAQMEYLLGQGAPMTVGFPENPDGGSVAAVPKRFVRCRQLLRPHYERRERRLKRLIRGHADQITAEEIEGRFYQAAFEGDMKWREALLVVGTEFGLLDIDRHPKPSAAKMLPEFRRAHRRGRRDACAEQAVRRLFETSKKQWASVAGLPIDEAARRLSVPVAILRSWLSDSSGKPRNKAIVMPLGVVGPSRLH